MTTPELLALEGRFTTGAYPKRDVVLVSGARARVQDADGRVYIDCAAGHGVANLGHGHPAIADAINAQARRLVTCSETFYNDVRAQLLERLAALLPGGPQRIFLCNSGTEAVEAALKFARLTTRRAGVVAAKRGFHGRTLGALSATWEPTYRQPFEPLVPGFSHVPFNDAEATTAAITDQTAAVILEIVQGEGGVRPGTREYFQAVRSRCDETGALLIIDEVQTGFGRTGRWFACQHHDLVPDLLCLGKAIAGGVPMAAVGLGPRVAPIPAGAHGSTFGGNPLACAAALAALDAYEREGLIDRAARSGDYLLGQLRAIDSPVIREVRGLGLMIGVELKVRVTPILRTLMEQGVLALPAGSTVLRLLPPLVIEQDDLHRVATTIASALAAAADRRPAEDAH